MKYLSAVPAYGRDYKSQAAVMADWKAGKDFLIQDLIESGYISIREKPADVILNVRYAKLTKVCVIK